jgi:hypothetical protein
LKKIISYSLLLLCPLLNALGQAPTLDWQRNIGGSADDLDLKAAQNFQGDLFISGTSYSVSTGNPDIPGNKGGADIFVSKLTDAGATVWAKNFGGTLDDRPVAMVTTTDGGVALLCYVNSIDVDFNATGVWLLKLDNAGNIGFKIHYGGNPDIKGGLRQTSDGGYIFHSTKIMGANGLDSWVVKINNLGAITWQQTYGSTGTEYAADILEYDSNYYLLGESNSTTLNWQTNNGNYDLLFLKVNSVGSTQWTRLWGGSGNDGGHKVVLDNFNSFPFTILGSSDASGIDVNQNNGATDIWLIYADETDFSGNNYSIGGGENDYPGGICFSENRSTSIMVGETFSDSLPSGSTSDTSNVLVQELFPSFGGFQWETILGGTKNDIPSSIIETIDGGLLIAGHSYSNDINLTGNKGSADFWLFKLSYPCPDVLELGSSVFSKSISRTANNSITTISTFKGTSAKTKLKSAYIEMNAGFKVEAGTVFETEIGGCD